MVRHLCLNFVSSYGACRLFFQTRVTGVTAVRVVCVGTGPGGCAADLALDAAPMDPQGITSNAALCAALLPTVTPAPVRRSEKVPKISHQYGKQEFWVSAELFVFVAPFVNMA